MENTPRAFAHSGTHIEEKREGVPMPRWMLDCRSCDKPFPYSEVTFEDPPSDAFAWLGNKPNFPDGGISVECPSCKETSLYQRYMLRFAGN